MTGMKDKYFAVKRICAEALGCLGVRDGFAIDALLTGIKDENVNVRSTAYIALERLANITEDLSNPL